MTTFFDATAVVALHIDTAARQLAERSLATASTDVCVSALSLTEALAVINRLTDEPALRDQACMPGAPALSECIKLTTR